jgi:kynurenine formamidase
MCLPGTVEAVRERQATLTRRAALASGGAAALAAALPPAASARPRRSRRVVIDLTHTFTEDFPVYVGPPPRRRTLTTVEANGFYKQEWTFDEHSGTHFDAPVHFIADGRRVPDIPAAELVVPIVVVDIARRAARDPDTVVTPDDLIRFERRHGRIPRHALVAMHSGWDEKLSDPSFKGTDAGGTYHFPGFGAEAVEWLLDRGAAGLGVDTLSLDHGPSTTFPVHIAWHGADRWGLENLANLGLLPPKGMVAIVGVIPWQDGSGGPARVLAVNH